MKNVQPGLHAAGVVSMARPMSGVQVIMGFMMAMLTTITYRANYGGCVTVTYQTFYCNPVLGHACHYGGSQTSKQHKMHSAIT